MAYLDDFQCPDERDQEELDSYAVDHDGRLRAGNSPRFVWSHRLRFAKQVGQTFQAFPSSHHTILILSDLVNFRDVLQA